MNQETFTIDVWLVRHGPTNANVMGMSAASHRQRKSIIDPVPTEDGLKLALLVGRHVYKNVFNYCSEQNKTIKYYTSLLPRTSITMLGILKGADISLENNLVERMNYIHEKENYGIRKLNSKTSDFNSWKRHMSGITGFKQAEIVGSSAVTNLFKSNQYVEDINKIFTNEDGRKPIDESNVHTYSEDLPDEYKLQIHKHSDLAKFLNLLIYMKKKGNYNEENMLFIVGHGDWIKDFLEEMTAYGLEREQTTYSKYYDEKIKNCEGHLLRITLPLISSVNKTEFPKNLHVQLLNAVALEPSNINIKNTNFITKNSSKRRIGIEHYQLINKYTNYYGFSSDNPYGTYDFGDIVDITKVEENLITEQDKPVKNENAIKFLKACQYMYYKSQLKNHRQRVKTLGEVNNNIQMKNKAKNYLGWNNSIKFGGIKTFTKVIHGRKRKIYIGPKGGKYYIKKDKNNKNKKVYIN